MSWYAPCTAPGCLSFVGLCATALATLIGVVVGVVAGYSSPGVDTVLSRLMDVVLSFPFLLSPSRWSPSSGPSLNISVVVIAFFSWAAIGRVVRGQTLSLREQEFVEAARSTGCQDLRIMTVEILPNLVSPVLVLATLIIPTAIVFEATLVVPGARRRSPDPDLGKHDQRLAALLQRRLVVHRGARPGSAAHDPRVQPARRRRPRRRSTRAPLDCRG